MAAGPLTNAGKTRIITGGALRPVCTHVGLYTGNPGAAGSHSTEVAAANGYSRQAVTWTASGSGVETNSNTVLFTATGSWGTLTHWGINSTDTRGAGTMYFRGALDSSRVVTNGNQVRFLPGALKIEGLTT